MLDVLFLGAIDVVWLVLLFRHGANWGAWALTLAAGGLEVGAFAGLWIVTALMWAAALFAFGRYVKHEA